MIPLRVRIALGIGVSVGVAGVLITAGVAAARMPWHGIVASMSTLFR